MGNRSVKHAPDRRREPREPLTGEVSILHSDDKGHEVTISAQLLDGSVNGARFRAQQQLPLRSPVVFYHRKLGVGGQGTVRYCNWSSQGYEIGVEFRQGINWRGSVLTESLRRLSASVEQPESAATPPAK